MNWNIIKSKWIVASLAVATALSSCQKFEDMNVNPNEPTVVSPDVLFASGIRQSVTTTTNQSFLLANNAAQITTKTLRTEIDAYNWNAFPVLWEGLYGSLTDFKFAEKFAMEEGNEAMQGACKVMRTWIMSTLTNAYGNIPYSEAIRGDEDILTPAYDDQESIYADMLNELDAAVALLEGEGQISGDLIFGNDASKWVKFANSLHLRLILTASAKLPDAATRFADVAGRSLMESNADNAALTYEANFPNQFPLIPIKTGDFDAVAISENMVATLEGLNDPRLMRYARPNSDDYTDVTSFVGAVSGSNSANCSKIGSRLGVQYYNYPEFVQASELGLPQAEGIIMTHAEVQFILAEGAANGWIGGSVEDYYRNGIASSMTYHQVDVAPFGWTDFEDYYANSGAAYDEVTDIWHQKWIALFFHGMEPYYEVRRWYVASGNSFTNIPFLSAPCEDLNGGALPMRFLYPGEEASLNAANYQDAIATLGTQNDRMWLVN